MNNCLIAILTPSGITLQDPSVLLAHAHPRSQGPLVLCFARAIVLQYIAHDDQLRGDTRRSQLHRCRRGAIGDALQDLSRSIAEEEVQVLGIAEVGERRCCCGEDVGEIVFVEEGVQVQEAGVCLCRGRYVVSWAVLEALKEGILTIADMAQNRVSNNAVSRSANQKMGGKMNSASPGCSEA